jgi:RHS repeat-associated protein
VSPYGGATAQTNYEWDAKWDKVTKITQPTGEITEVGYDPANGTRLWQQTGGSSRRVNFTYNTDGLLATTQWPSGATESIDYNLSGVANGISSPSGMYTHINNDVLGWPVTIVRPVDRGGVYASIDSTEYDLLGRVTRTAQWGPAMNGAPAQSLIVRNFYDPNGNLDSLQRISVPSRGIDTLTTRWTNDFANRRTVETGPDGRSDVTAYDPAGNAIQQTTRRGDVLTMTYDRLNRLVQRVVPSSHPYTSMNRGVAAKTSQGYDRIEDGPYPRYPLSSQSSLVVSGYTETFRYDPVSGFLTEADNADAQISRTYFPNGAINTETQRIANVDYSTFGSHVYTLSYQYDLSGRMKTLTHPSQLTPRNSQGTVLGSTTQYAYDGTTGYLNSVTDVLGKQFRAHVNNDGERDSLIAPSGIAESYSYDVDGNLANHYVTTAQLGQYPHPVSILRNDSFTYDAGGRLLTLKGTQGARETLSASYSGLGQMVSSHATSQGNDPNAPASFDSYETLTYDAFSNTFYSLTTGRFTESAGGTLTGYTGGTVSNNAKDYSYYDRTNSGRLHTQYYEADGRTDSYEYDEAGNTTFTTQTSLGSNGFMEDRASYFDAANHLRAADYRVLSNGYGFTSAINVTFEEYRYDALGRRVWVRTRRWCANSGGYDFKCRMSTVRRTVWDGNQELYEIQQPGYATSSVTEMENDGIPGEQPVSTAQMNQNYWDNNPFFGSTAYTHAFGIDQPLSVTRMNYSDHLYGMSFTRWDPYTVIPHWNSRGQPTNGSYGDGGRAWCLSATHCVNLRWPAGWFAYTRSAYTPYSWHGTLLEDKVDGAATYYRRNRVYDASTGRFTQEDPIGLAGGLNAYGFTAGDPVNYSDPFGLCPIPADNCPPGYWTAMGTAVGALIGGAGGGAGGFFAGAGVGAIPGAIGGAMQGAALGGAAGAFVDGIIFASKQGRAVQMATSLVDNINGHLETVAQDPNADDADHHRGEIRGWINRVQKYAEDMKGKTQEAWMKKVAEWKKALDDLTPK